VRGDTAFNEALATFIGRLGTRRWLAQRDEPLARQSWQERQALDQHLVETLLAARKRLAYSYGQTADPRELAAVKQREFDRLRADLREMAEKDAGRHVQAWLSRKINNAHLALVATYESGVAAFESLYRDKCNAELQCLYDHAEALAKADSARRAEFLRRDH